MPKVEKGFLKPSLIKSECNGSFRGAEAGLAPGRGLAERHSRVGASRRLVERLDPHGAGGLGLLGIGLGLATARGTKAGRA